VFAIVARFDIKPDFPTESEHCMKLLLINPKFPESFWSFKWAIDTCMPGVRTLNPPLGLATLAALCPSDWEVEIVDENVRSIPLDPAADIVGICGMAAQSARQKELLNYYRKKGCHVVAGGSYASLCPESYESSADTVVAGEAEYIWREFCRDYQMGSPQKLYRETGSVSLVDSPVPRFDLLESERYERMSIQFSRGCPYRCEFCDIIVMFGRRPRTKSLEQIGAELDQLRTLNAHDVFFVDDNLTGDKKAAKELLRYLADYQKRHNYSFQFGTEASLNLADDDELLQLLHDANFDWVFIGIESPNEESLMETKKMQNLKRDILSSVRKIYSYDIDVLGGFVIGFDSDTKDIFDQQYQFIVESGIQSAMIGPLVAVEKTPLFDRLQKEGRLRPESAALDNTKLATNFEPKKMSHDELIKGCQALYYRLLDYRIISERIHNKARYFTKAPSRNRRSLEESFRVMIELCRHIFKQEGMRGLVRFWRSLLVTRPKLVPMVVRDWVIGLSMKDYVDRHFALEVEKDRSRVLAHIGMIKHTLKRYFRQGSLDVTIAEAKNDGPNLLFSMKGKLGRDFFISAARQLEQILENTRSSVTIRIEEFNAVEIHSLKKMLNRLLRFRERIVIAADERSRRIIDIDSSVFTLAMNG
jgi:radical SAM superfamily enzyme YgiQ (UPF0313 family)